MSETIFVGYRTVPKFLWMEIRQINELPQTFKWIFKQPGLKKWQGMEMLAISLRSLSGGSQISGILGWLHNIARWSEFHHKSNDFFFFDVFLVMPIHNFKSSSVVLLSLFLIWIILFLIWIDGTLPHLSNNQAVTQRLGPFLGCEVRNLKDIRITPWRCMAIKRVEGRFFK